MTRTRADDSVRELEQLIATIVQRAGDDSTALATALGELGLDGIGIPEEQGGSGGELSDLCAALGALGRHAVSTPLLENAVAGWVLAEAGIAPRPARATIVLEHGTGIPWARDSDAVLVCPENGPTLLFDLTDAPLERSENIAGAPRDTLVSPVPSQPLPGAPARSLIVARIGLLSAAYLAGAITGAYELTRAYVREREQFGAPLIELPAVQRGLGLMRVTVGAASAAVAHAVDVADDETRSLAGSQAARTIAGQAATDVARAAHQLHGAIGITAEYPLHRWTRTLWAWRDYAAPQSWWTSGLGNAALTRSEVAVWDELAGGAEDHAYL
ncbi:acyl-CoA dehydrogenase family protein [Streptomyces sp. NPDC048415]|uniref:acyl-CoA dehydrogenase family protein n=1 Tax=Streptomyces sp. NPDC048415 TaxID=3154822 RepID=UPI00341F750D